MENKGTRNDCLDMFPAFFAVELLYFSVQILLLNPRAKVSKQGWKKREKRDKERVVTRKEKKEITLLLQPWLSAIEWKVDL